MSARIGLVGCASSKLKRPAPARDLYTSALFRKASAYAEATCDMWFILSAKHGLVDPGAVLEPYNVKLGSKGGPPIHDWCARVVDSLTLILDGLGGFDPTVVLLAGEQYAIPYYHLQRQGIATERPMEGLGIGEQLAWLNAELADRAGAS